MPEGASAPSDSLPFRCALAQLPVTEYRAACGEVPVVDLLVYLEARLVKSMIDDLRNAMADMRRMMLSRN